MELIGKVKTVPIDDPKAGMRVYIRNGETQGIMEIDEIWGDSLVLLKDVKNRNPTFTWGYKVKNLLQLVVECESEAELNGFISKPVSGIMQQYPLKYSHWQKAIDEELIDCDKPARLQTFTPYQPLEIDLAELIIDENANSFTVKDMERAFINGYAQGKYHPEHSSFSDFMKAHFPK